MKPYHLFLNISFFTLSMLMLLSCNAQDKKSDQPAKDQINIQANRIDNLKATTIAGMAFTNLMDVTNIEKYSSSCGSENYLQPDEYYSVVFQDKGSPYFLAHLTVDGKIIYMQKLFPAEPAKKELLDMAGASKIAEDLVFYRLQARKGQYKVTKAEQEKVGKGIDAYWIITLDKDPEVNKNKRVPYSLIVKIHPKTHEVMVLEYKY